MTKSSYKLLAYSLLFFVVFYSCSNPFKIDLKGIDQANVHIERYERALFQQGLDGEYIKELQLQFPLFLGNDGLDSMQMEQLLSFVRDPYLRKLYEETEKTYPDLSNIEQELSISFSRIKYYFPTFVYPEVYSYISGNQDAAFYQDGIVMVSLDHYLGYGHEAYNVTQTPKYKQFVMSPDYFVRDILMALAEHFIAQTPQEAHLIDHMIYQGKLLYFIKSMLPEMSDQVLFAQTSSHMEWLYGKERDLWRYYIENELLYKSDYMAYNNFINDAPFTSVLGDDSAPRTGIWLGYQIVYSFMEKNELSLVDLLKENNGQKLLIKSGYKPTK